MYYKSIWKDTKKLLKYPKLDKDIDVDVLIIGGGIAGVSCAYHLNNHFEKICLVEKNKIGLGVTSGSTGKLTYLQDNILGNIKEKDKYLKSQLDAIKIGLDIIKKNNIECDLEKTKSYLFSTKDEDIKKIKDIKKLLEENKIKVKEDKLPLIETNYCISSPDTYILDPVKLVYGMVETLNNVDIYENTRILDIRKDGDTYICKTEKNIIRAKKVIVAVHYPYFSIPYLFPIKGKLEKSYLSASKYDIKPISAISYDKPTISFRTHKDYLIYLTNSQTLGTRLNDKKEFEGLIKKLKDKGLKPSYLWSNKDIITNDYMPYVGYIKDNILLVTGFNTWGISNGLLSGNIIKDILLGNSNDYIELFNPKRANNLNAVTDAWCNVKAFTKAEFYKNKNIEYLSENNQEIAIYRDANGEHKVYTICPHLGCKLIFNEVEKTWDCPCHGSRFDIDGKSIEGPSNYDIGV